MPIVGIRETERVIGWAITRANSVSAVKHVYVIKQVPNRPYVAVSADQEALDVLYAELYSTGLDDFEVGALKQYEISAAGL